MRNARPRWNANVHYHRLVHAAVPAGARSALNVGTGNGLLAVELRDRVDHVTGIDAHEATLRRAAREHADVDVEWVLGDVLTHEFGRRFDVVASIATLHHLPDLDAGLRRLASLVEPGGVLVIVGLARASGARDAVYGVLGAVQHAWFALTRGVWEHDAPKVWPPPHTYRQVRHAARRSLPGSRWQQLPMWRYAVTWRRADDRPGR